MQLPDTTATWVGVAIVIAILIVLVAVVAVRRSRGPGFELRPLPEDRLDSYAERLNELEGMFVTKPREAVASARQLVDEMLALKGYPARMRPADRARDMGRANRAHADRYRTAAQVDERSTTEEMRRSMEHLLALGRELVDGDRGRHAGAPSRRAVTEPAATEPAVARSSEDPEARREPTERTFAG